MSLSRRLYLLPLFAFLLLSCEEEEVQMMERYEGPLMVMRDTETFYSDSAELKARVTAPTQFEFQNGDREFPDGIRIEFFGDSSKITSTLRANHGKFLKAENLYVGTGDVEVRNPVKQEQLNSEELKWNEKTGRVFTEKFVIIRTQSGIIKGTQFESDQTFTRYKILNPTGEYEIEAEGAED